MYDHVAMISALGGVLLGILGFVLGRLYERYKKVGPLVDRLLVAEAAVKKRG